MPSDLIINVRQVSSYPELAASNGTETVLVQQGGLGGPYASIDTATLVSTALSGSTSLGVGAGIPTGANGSQVFTADLVTPIDGAHLWNQYEGTDGNQHYWQAGPAASFEYDTEGGFLWLTAGVGSPGQVVRGATELMTLSPAGAMNLPGGTITVARDPSTYFEVATAGWVSNNTVGSFNQRKGQVTLNASDVYGALKLCDPIATQPWVQQAITNSLQNLLYTCPFVNTWNGRQGQVYLMLSDITCVFYQSGQQPISPTPLPTSNDDSIATTKWVINAFQPDGGTFLPISGGTMTGKLTAPWLETDGPINQVCYPVGNSPWPENPNSPGALPVNCQLEVQGLTTQGAAQAEWTAVFGNYINTGQPNGQKVTVYAGAVQGPLGGSAWSLNTLIVRNGIPSNAPGGPGNVGSSDPGTPGAIAAGNSTIGYELDLSNYDQDCAPGVGAFTVGIFVSAVSLFKSLAGIYFGGETLTPGKHLWHHGIFFSDLVQTGMTIERSAIFDGTHAAVSYEDGGVHSACSYYANDTSPNAIQINGNHSAADIFITDNAPDVIHVNGSHTTVVDLSGATVTGVAWNGQFSATGIDATPIGAITPSTGVFTDLAAADATVTGLIRGEILTGGGMVGGVGTTPGDATHAGWVAFYNAAGVRLGYIGYGDAGGTYIQLETEGSYVGYQVLGELLAATRIRLLNSAGPTLTSGAGAPTGTQPSGSLWMRTDGAVGSHLYISAGGGTWNPVAGA